ncbi:MAG TPA: hypothetical protein VEU96_24890 [Bryobacteraceae bacterium]|nr:hypothetical protein [Bryobacteraceae bacterium]
MTIVSRCALTCLAAVFAGLPPALHAQNQTPANVKYTGDTTAKNHASAKLSAVVTNNSDKPAEGGKLTFKLGSQTCSAVTDKAGKGGCTLILNQPAGKYTVDVDFGGSRSLYAGASGTTAAFVITK